MMRATAITSLIDLCRLVSPMTPSAMALGNRDLLHYSDRQSATRMSVFGGVPMQLNGKVALITGSSRGLGAVIAEQYVKQGASVILMARSLDALEDKAKRLTALCQNSQRVLTAPGDISVPRTIDEAFDTIQTRFEYIDIVVNNAGVFTPMGDFEKVAWSDWVKTIETNISGTAYLCRKSIPLLRGSSRGKIINIAGGGATRPIPPLSAYGTSKAAILRLTEELADYLKPSNIDVNSVAPGPLDTYFVDVAIEAGPERVGWPLYREILQIRKSGGTPMSMAANLCTFLGSQRSDAITGRFFSARFDDWDTLADRRDVLDGSELYKMRRLDPDTIARLKHLAG